MNCVQKRKKRAGRKRVRTEGGVSWDREEPGAVGREPRVSRRASRLTGRDFPGGSVVQNAPSASGHAGSIPSQGTKIPRVTGQLSPCVAIREAPWRNKACVPSTAKTKF